MDITLTQIMFWALAALAVLAALGVVLSRNAIYSALCLVGTMFCLAGLFVLLNAQFLAAAQVIVYAGAVMVLFLFAIMLLNAGQAPGEERLTVQAGLGWLFGIALAMQLAALVYAGFTGQTSAPTSRTGGPQFSATENIAPGGSALVTVRDSYANADPDIVDKADVEFILTPGNESETITLTETGPDTDTFQGAVKTKESLVPGAPEDGVFSVKDGQHITANYEDTHTGNYRTAVIHIRNTALDMPSKVTPGQDLTITLGAIRANAEPTAIDTVKLLAGNTVSGEREDVVLTETGPDTGIFTGALKTEYGTVSGRNNDGRVKAKGGDTISVLYETGLKPVENTVEEQGIAVFDENTGSGNVLAQAAVEYGATESVALTLFAKYLYPFEVIAVLLLIAMIGAVLIAKKRVKKS